MVKGLSSHAEPLTERYLNVVPASCPPVPLPLGMVTASAAQRRDGVSIWNATPVREAFGARPWRETTRVCGARVLPVSPSHRAEMREWSDWSVFKCLKCVLSTAELSWLCRLWYLSFTHRGWSRRWLKVQSCQRVLVGGVIHQGWWLSHHITLFYYILIILICTAPAIVQLYEVNIEFKWKETISRENQTRFASMCSVFLSYTQRNDSLDELN